MIFPALLDRGETELLVRVAASVQPYANAIGCPDEMRSRFTGRVHVELLSVTDAATGADVAIEDHECDYLRELAVAKIRA